MGFLKLTLPAWELVIRSVGIYLALLIGFRLFGKREVGQFTLFDLVLVLLVANAVQPAMTGPDSSLTGGLVIIVVLLLANYTISWLRLRFPAFNRLVEPAAVTVAEDGHWLDAQLRRQGITPDECMEALREHGLEKIEQTRLVVLEPDGSLSVVPKDHSVHHRRRVRFIRHP